MDTTKAPASAAPFQFIPWNDPEIGPAVELPPMPYGVSNSLGKLIVAYVSTVGSGEDEEYQRAFLPIEAYRARGLPDIVAKYLITMHRNSAGLAADCNKLLIIIRDEDELRRDESLLADLYAQMPQDWSSARRAYDAARASELAYDKDVWTPAYEVLNAGGGNIPSGVEAEMERRSDIRDAAENILLDLPARNLADFAFKFLICFGDGRERDAYNAELCAEAKRLIAEGGAV